MSLPLFTGTYIVKISFSNLLTVERVVNYGSCVSLLGKCKNCQVTCRVFFVVK